MRLSLYRPYTKQRSFHDASRQFRERCFLAGNQLGKTVAGGAEVAMHLTGQYPDWWNGRRWDRPIVAWAAGVTGESTRDNPQRVLMGRPGSWGTGMLPGSSVDDGSVTRAAHGVADLVDTLQVRHASGGMSSLGFKFYEKGRDKWQGETLDLVWFDEEPPPDIYAEGLTRTNATGGITMLTATPLKGMTDVVHRFYPHPDTPDRHLTRMEIEDAEHYTAEERARIVSAYSPHERDARSKGLPLMGSGLVFPVAESEFVIDPFPIPEWYGQLAGLDFGWDHPTAAARVAHDAEADIVYVTHTYRQQHATPVVAAAGLKAWGKLPFAWPHDGLNTEKGTGEQLKNLYADQGLEMMPIHAQTLQEGNKVEPALFDMLDRMQTGRLKVFSHLTEWLDERRAYHRDERGVLVKERDDLISATRYAIMMLRYAKRTKQREQKQDAYSRRRSQRSPWAA